MNTKNDALKLSLEALEMWCPMTATYLNTRDKAITVLREALAEQPAQQQEPVTWKDEQGNVRMALDAGEIQSSVGYVYSVHGERIKNACIRSDIPNGTPLYTSPPAQRTWIGLTDEEIQKIWRNSEHMTVNQVCRAIEAKLREKNNVF